MSITNEEFEHLLEKEKLFEDDSDIVLGPHPIEWTREIISTDNKDKFLLDFNRGNIEVTKHSINERYRQSIIIVRFCSHGIHTNPPPDNHRFEGPHVHIFKEGFDDKFAYPISEIGLDEDFTHEDSMIKMLDYINVINRPGIQSTID